jgi:hypothetical protein
VIAATVTIARRQDRPTPRSTALSTGWIGYSGRVGCRVTAMIDAETQAIYAIVTAMRPILAGHSPGVQSGALADCLALWLAGHQIPGDEDATRELRAGLLAEYCSLVRALVPLNARQLGTQE